MKIIKREEWSTRPPRNSSIIKTPTAELWLHHSAGDHKGPVGVRRIQNFHMDNRGWWDIGYSYLIDPTANDIYEGRGAGKLGGHTFGHNAISHAICIMGNYQELHPSIELIGLIADFVRYGHQQGWWPNQLSGGHRDVAATACPGDNLYPLIDDINELALQPTKIDPPKDKIDRVIERVWNLEVISVIDRTFYARYGWMPKQQEIANYLNLAREEGVDYVIDRISNGVL